MARLEPKKDVVRNIALKSGNKCSFPNCNEEILNDEDKYIGQLAHIEAAEPNGPRYNQNQTDEERRAEDNLMFMCYKHHKIIDNDTKTYTVQILKDMKHDHETTMNKVKRLTKEQIKKIVKETIRQEKSYLKDKSSEPNNNGYESFIKWLKKEEYIYDKKDKKLIIEQTKEIIQLINELGKGTREVLYFIIKKSHNSEYINFNIIFDNDNLEIEFNEFINKLTLLRELNIIEDRRYYDIEEQISGLNENILYTWKNGYWTLTSKSEILKLIFRYFDDSKAFKDFLVDLNLNILD